MRTSVLLVSALVAAGTPVDGATQSVDNPFDTRLGAYAAAFSHRGQYVDPGLGLRITQGVHRYVLVEADVMYVSAREGLVCIGYPCGYGRKHLLFGGTGVQVRIPLTLVEPYAGASLGIQWSKWHTRDLWEPRPSTAVFIGSRVSRTRYGVFGELRTRGDRYQTTTFVYREWNWEWSFGAHVRVR